MEKIYRIAYLIQQYILGQLRNEDSRELENWMNESDRHRKLVDDVQGWDCIEKQQLEYEQFDEQKAFKRFKHDKQKIDNRKRINRIVSIASMIALVCCISIYMMRKDRERVVEPLLSISPIIESGRSKATLILDNGNVVALTDSVALELEVQHTKIKIEGDQVSYSNERVLSDSLGEKFFNTIVTPQGGEYKLMLSDGTRVWLNAKSELRYPIFFGGQERKVYVVGEAYFEVAKDSLHPFLVETEKSVVKVLGTSFNVRAYPTELCKTTLMEGHVVVYSGGKMEQMKPNEQWVWDENGGTVCAMNPRVALCWKNGNFAFEEQELSTVFRELERWYDVRIVVMDQRINKLKFTGIFPRYGDLNKVLEIIELTTCVCCRVDNRNILVYDEK